MIVALLIVGTAMASKKIKDEYNKKRNSPKK